MVADLCHVVHVWACFRVKGAKGHHAKKRRISRTKRQKHNIKMWCVLTIYLSWLLVAGERSPCKNTPSGKGGVFFLWPLSALSPWKHAHMKWHKSATTGCSLASYRQITGRMADEWPLIFPNNSSFVCQEPHPSNLLKIKGNAKHGTASQNYARIQFSWIVSLEFSKLQFIWRSSATSLKGFGVLKPNWTQYFSFLFIKKYNKAKPQYPTVLLFWYFVDFYCKTLKPVMIHLGCL